MSPAAKRRDDGRHFSRRERQIMDILHRRKAATVQEIRSDLPDAPTDSAVRALLRLLEAKDCVRHRMDERRLVYMPAGSPARARQRAIRHVLKTFFEGSRELLVSTLLSTADRRLDDAELDRLTATIERWRSRDRRT